LGALVIDMTIVKLLVLVFVPGSFQIFTILGGQDWAELKGFLTNWNGGIWFWIAPLIYMVILQGWLSRTIGMFVLKLRVATVDGRKIGWLKAVFRTFGYVLSFLILGLGFAPILFDKKRQGLHDRLTKTFVVMK
jgi:uncharacterized RDD family membrane protein YckC